MHNESKLYPSTTKDCFPYSSVAIVLGQKMLSGVRVGKKNIKLSGTIHPGLYMKLCCTLVMTGREKAMTTKEYIYNYLLFPLK